MRVAGPVKGGDHRTPGLRQAMELGSRREPRSRIDRDIVLSCEAESRLPGRLTARLVISVKSLILRARTRCVTVSKACPERFGHAHGPAHHRCRTEVSRGRLTKKSTMTTTTHEISRVAIA